MAARILVVDDDAVIREFIVASLIPSGYEVTTASDGSSALAHAVHAPPDLVISDVMMPSMDGWAFVRRLRAHPRLAFVPFIFLSTLSSAKDILKGFRLGADDYLAKPFTDDELVERVVEVLRRRKHIETSARGMISDGEEPAESGLRGSLADVGISSILVLLEIEKKSGALDIRSEMGEQCHLAIRGGRVFEARVESGPPLRGAEAVYYLLGWSSGSFVFASDDSPLEDTVHCSTSGLLMEAARRADESSR
ncbi:MAG: response regulator [Myxococcales bacterium]|nr:response regulator [Myxococcales bacterium]